MEQILIPYHAVKIIEGAHVLVFAPHPDDEVFGCGGAILCHVAAGNAVRVVVVTDGGFGVAEEGRAEYVRIRQDECRDAAGLLGYGEPEFWGGRDRGVNYGEKLVRQVLEAIQNAGADLVYAPSVFEMHPDHRAVGMAVVEAVRRYGKGLRLALYEVGMPLRPNLLLDISDFAVDKMAAMKCFVSQNVTQRYDADISALNRYRSYTLPISVTAAEAYILVSAEELAGDPLKLYQSEHDRQRELGLSLDSRDAPLVSVIIRSTDRATLSDALDSVALQIYPNIEVVVVNAKGASHREMGEWCGRFPLRCIGTDKPLRRSRAANMGLDAAHGEYLIFLDDDDWFDADHIQKLATALSQHPEFKVVYTGVKCVDESKKPLTHKFDTPFDAVQIVAGNFIPMHAALFSRNLLDLSCRLDESLDLFEDWDFWIQLSMHGDFLKIDGLSAVYRITQQTGFGVKADPVVAERGTWLVHKKWLNQLNDRQITGLVQAVMHNRLKDSQISDLRQTVAERDGVIVNLGQTIESLIVDRDSRKASLEQQKASFEALARERDEHVSQLNRTVESLIVDRDSRKAGFEQLQSSKDHLQGSYDQLQDSYDYLQGSHDQLQDSLDHLQGSYEQSQSAYVQQQNAFGLLQGAFESLAHERDDQVSQLNQVISERQREIGNLRMELSAMYNSKSWRLTSPLRSLFRGIAKIISYASRRVRHHALPTSLKLDHETDAAAKPTEMAAHEQVNRGFRILLVSHYCPTRAHAGGLRILDIYALIRQHCPNVQLDLLTHHRPDIDWSLDDVHRIFHNVYLSPTESLTPDGLALMSGSSPSYDVVDLQFHQSGYQMDAFRRIGGKIIFTPMESLTKVLFIDMRARFLKKGSLRLFKVATSLRLAAEEIDFALKADEVVCVSRADAAFLRAVTSSRHVRGVDTGISQFEFAEALSPDYACAKAVDRSCRILYVAYFGSETNVVALLWYLDHVHPLVKASVPGYILTVVGRGDMSVFARYRDNSTEFVGEVPELAPYIRQARVGIAPALGGSGFRGKVNQYAVLGVPCVVSPIAFKGLAYQDGVNIFIAETPEMFSDRCIRLLTDLELNDRIGQAARKQCMERYSWQSKWPTLRKIYKLDEVELT